MPVLYTQTFDDTAKRLPDSAQHDTVFGGDFEGAFFDPGDHLRRGRRRGHPGTAWTVRAESQTTRHQKAGRSGELATL